MIVCPSLEKVSMTNIHPSRNEANGREPHTQTTTHTDIATNSFNRQRGWLSKNCKQLFMHIPCNGQAYNWLG